MSMLTRVAVLASLLLTVLAGASSAQGPAQEREKLLIGLIPEENIFRQVIKHRPLAAYISEKLGIEVKFIILSKYGDIIDRFEQRELDGAFFGIFPAVLAHEKLGVEPLVRPVAMDGSTTSEGYLIVREDSGIKTIKDLTGKRAAFVDRASVTGYIFPVSLLRENGVANIDKYFAEYYFTGSQDSVVYAVLDGRADVGAVKSRIFNRLVQKDPIIKDEVRIIARSLSLPDTTLCLKTGISPELRRRLKELLLAIHQDPRGREVLKSMDALKFVEAGMPDFGNVVTLIKKAGIDLGTYKYER